MFGISPTAGMSMGGALGAALGQVGNVLSAPRKGLWNMIGQPLGIPADALESGSGLLAHLGMDQDNPLTHALGMGLEVATDPLTYAGGIFGRLGAGAAEAGLAGKIGGVAGNRAGAEAALVRQALEQEAADAAAQAAAKAASVDRFSGFGKFMDPDSLANPDIGRIYSKVDPLVAAHLEKRGLGEMMPGGSFNMQAGLHPELGIEGAPKMGGMSRAGGTKIPSTKGVPPPFMETKTGGSKNTLVTKPGAKMPEDFPDPAELAGLRQKAAELAGSPEAQGLPFQNLHNQLSGADVFSQAGAELAPHATAPPISRMYGGMPANEAFSKTQDMLAQLLGQQQQRSMQADFLDKLLKTGGIAGLGGGAYGAGNYLFGGNR